MADEASRADANNQKSLVALTAGGELRNLRTAADGTLLVSATVSGSTLTAATATLSNVNDSATNVTLQAANALRVGLSVFNDSTTNLYLKLGATASTTSFTVLILAGGYWEMPPLPNGKVYQGIVDGIWSADASGAARMTEYT